VYVANLQAHSEHHAYALVKLWCPSKKAKEAECVVGDGRTQFLREVLVRSGEP
jgi:hypothetical protein